MTEVVTGTFERLATPGSVRSAAPTRLRWGRGFRYLMDAVAAVGAVSAMNAVFGVSRPVGAILVPVWLVLLVLGGSGEVGPVGNGVGRTIPRVLTAAAGLGLLSWVAVVVSGTPEVSRDVLLAIAALTAASLTIRLGSAIGAGPGRARSRLLVVGEPSSVRRAQLGLAADPGLEVSGLHVDTDALLAPAPGTPASVPAVANLAQSWAADAVLVFPSPGTGPEDLRRLAWQLEETGADLLVGTGLYDVRPHRTTTLDLAGVGALHVRAARRRGPAHWAWHLAGRAAAGLGLLLLLPLLVAIAIAIRVETPGPAIFRQTRVGREGRIFTMYKFRSMREVSLTDDQRSSLNECDAVLFKSREDPRITPLGRLLRRYSLDELPQLINVVRGDMTLIGPRPALPGEVEQYTQDVHRRFAVAPGLTGLWQVSGRSDLSWDETVRLDLTYVDNWSLALDLDILRRTARAVLGHRGAY